ncbi:MAG: class I SAM-dependent methyltransferase [Gammaproteobacteria bacterium]|nr:class I SAM-dependent methyltransferase [Gammaproteobacteria bacterium]
MNQPLLVPAGAREKSPGLVALRQWYGTPAGVYSRSCDVELASTVLPDLFGYHFVQVGQTVEQGAELADFSRISHRVIIDVDSKEPTAGSLASCADALPILANSVDVLVLPHTLEFCPNPQGILREAERVLIGEGHLLILGFNPWSLYGMWRRALAWRGAAPWSGRFFSPHRLRDWLGVLGLVVERVVRVSFRPPVSHAGVHRRLEVMERLGGHFWPVCGNAYGILACKRVMVARPVRLHLRRQRRAPVGSVVEPSANGFKSRDLPKES